MFAPCAVEEFWKVVRTVLSGSNEERSEYEKRIKEFLDGAGERLAIAGTDAVPGILEDSKEFESLVKERIPAFYDSFLEVLERLTDDKVRNIEGTSKKLKKLADRESLHPERGDVRLLARAILLHERTKEPVCIMTEDNDFIHFAGDIEQEFGLRIVTPP